MARGFTIVSRRWLRLLCLGALICALGGGIAPARAQHFSADLIRTAVDGGVAASFGKLGVSDEKVRIETPDFPDGFFLVDGARHAAYFARPGERVFMDARQSSRLTQLFVPLDSGEPCLQWQAMAKLAGAAEGNEPWRCDRVGEEKVGGRDAVVYRAASSPGRDFVGWIDPKLKFPLRIRLEDGTSISIENIREEPQPAGLFEIPPGFGKFDPEALLKRIKQSDVWVEETPP